MAKLTTSPTGMRALLKRRRRMPIDNRFSQFDKYKNLVLETKIKITEANLTTIGDIFDSYPGTALAAVESNSQLIWLLGANEENLANGIELLNADPRCFELSRQPKSLSITLKPA